jgi:glutamate/tyrosine decarboxylase-like PLP-dependent enzyme
MITWGLSNGPYDCGIAIVADPVAIRSTFGTHFSYLIADNSGSGDPHEKVPEFSRRARGVPVWAALRSLGRSGVANLVEGLALHARAMAEGIATIRGVQVVNDIVYTQVCVRLGDDARTRAVTARLIADGTVWMSGSRWRNQDVLRISVSNWSTDATDVSRAVDAVRRAVDATGG